MQECTFRNKFNATFVKVFALDLIDKMDAAATRTQAAPILQQFISSTRVKTDSRMTGRTEVIQGVEAEERETTASLDLPAANSSEIPKNPERPSWSSRFGPLREKPACETRPYVRSCAFGTGSNIS
jgi:hypothetical protein